jgi:hypothetical protein
MYAYPSNESDYGTHPQIIYNIVKYTNCKKYLELGIYDGDCITNISNIVEKAVGVDIHDKRVYFNFTFLMKTTDDFFKDNTETFDIIFIDADHSYESVKKDFENALKILNKHGIIFLHDTDPIGEKFLNPIYCGDSYKMLDYIHNYHPELDIINLPISQAGLTIINRKDDNRFKNYIK